MHWPLRGLLVSSLILLSACAGMKTRTDLAKTTPEEAANSVTPGSELPPASIDEREESSEIVEEKMGQTYKSAYGEIPLDYNEHVEKWIRYFQGRGRPHMEIYLSRSSRYLPMMKNVLRENGLPEELVYIALIESGFSPKAHSRANAVGYWQFIRGTGKRFGLQIDTFTDERRDPVLSTKAAVEYFKALYAMFNSWHLSMAAYNVGEARVKRVVTKYYTRDFWQIIKKRRALPAETKQYVPKFIAATLIAKNPEKYGFTNIEYSDPLSYDTVALTSPISLSKLASNLGVETEELQLLNPKFRTDFVPISRGSETVVRIPVGRATDAQAALSLSVTTQPKILQAEYYFYRVRRGDTLSTVARKHRTTVSQLRRLNGLSNRSMIRAGRSLKVPDNGGDGIKFVTEEDTRTPSASRGGPVPAVDTQSVEFHTVRRGENLSTIANRYGVSVSDLLRLNGLSNRSVIRKGQKIRVREGQPTSAKRVVKKKSTVLAQYGRAKKVEASAQPVRSAAALSKSKKHTVRRGETLWDVSKRYNVSLNELAKANRVKINHRVMAGEKLLIPD